MAPLFSKPTVAEYEHALRSKETTAIQVLEEMMREDPLYRASAIKEAQTRAKWAGMTPLRWMYCELKAALEKYEVPTKQLEEPKKEQHADPLRDLYDRNQRKGVQEPFFDGPK